MRSVTPAEMRAIDKHAIEVLGIPGVVLMENAGVAVVDTVLRVLARNGRVAIVAGKGNNGGDGLVVARHLANHAVPMDVFLVGETFEPSGDAKIQLDIVYAMGVPTMRVADDESAKAMGESLQPADVIVDALLGTGLRGEVQGLIRTAIDVINDARGMVIAVDTPSGLCGETGKVLGAAVRANVTVTFQLAKTGFQADASGEYTGEVEIVDIGVPPQCYASEGGSSD